MMATPPVLLDRSRIEASDFVNRDCNVGFRTIFHHESISCPLNAFTRVKVIHVELFALSVAVSV